jgi:hypothetical protein
MIIYFTKKLFEPYVSYIVYKYGNIYSIKTSLQFLKGKIKKIINKNYHINFLEKEIKRYMCIGLYGRKKKMQK